MDALHTPIAAIFDQVQTSVANHKKNSIGLGKIHVEAVKNVQRLADGSLRLTGEHWFSRVFVDMLGRVLLVKKGVQPADRVLKFVGSYVAYILEKGASTCSSSESDSLTHTRRSLPTRSIELLLRRRRFGHTRIQVHLTVAQVSFEGIRREG